MNFTSTDFSAPFGQAELLALTNPEGEVVDESVFDLARDDALAEMGLDVNLADYQGQLPQALLAILADLTRARLYTDEAPAIISRRADSARAMLRAFASNKAGIKVISPKSLLDDNTTDERNI